MSLINSSGFKYYMDRLDVNQSALSIAYDFTQTSLIDGEKVLPTTWSSGCYTGIVNGNKLNFFQKSGSGYFDGSNSIDINGKINSDDFSFLFCYEKLSTGSQILLSSAQGSTFNAMSGLTLGVNDVNKLYLEYWNPVDGKFSKIYSKNIGSKNIVYLNKGFGSFNFGILDVVESKLNIESVPIYNSAYAHSDRFRIGNKFSSNTWSNGGAFNGYFDDFYCLNKPLPQDYFGVFCSGFYSAPVIGQISGVVQSCKYTSILSGSGVNLGTGITGYETNITYQTGYIPTGCFNSGYSYLAGTGVTGYYEKYIGDKEDNCGNIIPIYVKTPLTGSIYMSGNILKCTGSGQVITPIYNNKSLTGFLTGSVFVEVLSGNCSGINVYYPNYIAIDSGFLYSLGYDGVFILQNCPSNKINDIYFYPNQVNNNLNLIPSYDSFYNEYLVKSNHSGSGKNLIFNNGRLLLESGWSSYVDGYNTKYNLTGDIFLDNQIIRSNGGNKKTDTLLYDNSNNINRSAVLVNTFRSPGSNISDYFPSSQDMQLFLNGFKLIKGIDYSNSNINIAIPASSVLIKVNGDYVSNNFINYTGYSNLFILPELSGKFIANSSTIYKSGYRCKKNIDYLECSKLDLLSSGCLNNKSINLLHDSSIIDNFWNI